MKTYLDDRSGPQNLYFAVCGELPPRDLDPTLLPALLELLDVLSVREEQFIKAYYGLGQEKLGSLEYIGEKLFGVKHVMTSKIKANAIRRLQDPTVVNKLVFLFGSPGELYDRIKYLTQQNDYLIEANQSLDAVLQETRASLHAAEERLEKVLGYEHAPLSMPIEEIFSGRVLNAFDRRRQKTAADMVVLTERQVMRTPGIGQKSLTEIKEKLGELGLELRKEDLPSGRTVQNSAMGKE